MISSRFLRQTKPMKNIRFFWSTADFSQGTIAGVFNEAREKNQWLDWVRFGGQNLNWTNKEFDEYTKAFAYGMMDQGYKPGDKLLLWLDSENSAEISVAQIGAMKSGMSIVTVDHSDEVHHVGDALEASGANGVILSPHTRLDGKIQRANLLLDLFPELARAYPGSKTTFDNFPNVRSIMHTGHVSIRGTSKFKENMLYTKKSLTNLRLEGSEESGLAMEWYKRGEQVASLSNTEILKKAKNIWNKYLDGEDKQLPVFLTLSLQYPLGFASFIASVMNGRKVYIPSTYNVAKIAKSFNFQKSDVLICEEEVFRFEPPMHKLDEVKEHISHFKKVLVAGEDSNTESHVFEGVNADHTNLYLH